MPAGNWASEIVRVRLEVKRKYMAVASIVRVARIVPFS